jgi:hypothetical protein
MELRHGAVGDQEIAMGWSETAEEARQVPENS